MIDLFDFLKEEIERFAEEYQMDVRVYKEMAFDITQINEKDPITDETIQIFLNSLGGEITNETANVPVQLTCLSKKNSYEDAKLFLDDFAATYSTKNGQIFDQTIKQIISTSTVVQNFIEDGDGYRSMLYTGCNFFIMGNIDTIEAVNINDELIDFLDCQLAFSANQSSSQITNETLLKSLNQTGNITLQLTLHPVKSVFTQKLRSIRTEQASINTPFTIDLTYADGAQESYKMIVTGQSISSPKNGVDTMQVTFTQTR